MYVYVYDSADAPEHVAEVLDRLDGRESAVEYIDVDAAETRADGRREAMLTIKNAVGIGTPPSELFGPDGRPDLTVGALITDDPSGRRSLHVGRDALDALDR